MTVRGKTCAPGSLSRSLSHPFSSAGVIVSLPSRNPLALPFALPWSTMIRYTGAGTAATLSRAQSVRALRSCARVTAPSAVLVRRRMSPCRKPRFFSRVAAIVSAVAVWYPSWVSAGSGDLPVTMMAYPEWRVTPRTSLAKEAARVSVVPSNRAAIL